MIFNSTITALSTPPGKGGVAVIRMSGEDAIAIAERCFRARCGKPLASLPSRTAIYGDFLADGEAVDDLLLTIFRAPSSYTGEDTVEIASHGSSLIVSVILETLIKNGAVPAERGEFTRRAFTAGKLGLSEAEAIGELLDAKSMTQLKLFGKDSRSRLSKTLGGLYEGLETLVSTVYAKIDYPDEDLADLSEAEILARAEEILAKATALSSTYKTGRAIAEGIPTVLLGKPNTGKSSLYNLLCGRDAAIVTEYAGTTRDVLEATVTAGKVLLRLADTAGVRETDDPIEKIGVTRSRETAESAELVLALFDASLPADGEDEALWSFIDGLKGEKIALLNKSDLDTRFDTETLVGHFEHILPISVKGNDCEGLFRLIEAMFTDERIHVGEDAILSSARQHAALASAISYIKSAIEALRTGYAQDAAVSDLELALGALAETDGRAVSDGILSAIFSKFCVGK